MEFEILNNRARGAVFKITSLEDGTFEVLELCDENFAQVLTPAELKLLGEEIIQLSQNTARA